MIAGVHWAVQCTLPRCPVHVARGPGLGHDSVTSDVITLVTLPHHLSPTLF